MKYKISTFAKMHGRSYRTIWNWISKGLVKTEKDATGHTWIIEDPENTSKGQPDVVVYARVSSSENKDNLESQAKRLVSYCNARGYKVMKVVKEVGSGLNDSRPKLEKILLDKSIDIIVVEHKDRLARFGLNYIEKLLSLDNRRIEIVNNVDGEKEDLVQDFISIITSFCARIYGNRRSKRATEKLIKKIEEENKKDDINRKTCDKQE